MKQKTLSSVLAGIAAAFVLFSCDKDTPGNTWPSNTSSNGALNAFLVQHSPPVQTFNVDAAQGGSFYAIGGAEIYVYPYAFVYQNNLPVTGNVTVNVQEVYTKRDIIFSGAFTTANGLPLVSGGEINVTAYQGSQELKLGYSGAVYVEIPTPTGAPAMTEFRGSDFGPDRDFVLVDSPAVAIVTDSFSTNYGFGLDSLDWTNCDQYWSISYNTNATMTEFSIPVSQLFDDENSFVLVTSSYSTFASRIWDYDPSTHTFLCNYYRLPVGYDFTFTIVSEINGAFYYDSRTVTITENISIPLNPQTSTEAQILQNIGNL